MISKHRGAILALFFVLLFASLAIHSNTAAAQDGSEWLALYWDNIDFAGSPSVERLEPAVDHRWGGGSPAPSIPDDRFSARWTNSVNLEGGSYRFTTRSDDGIRVWVDDNLLIDNWTVHPETVNTAVTELAPGQHQIRVDYFENTGLALAVLTWQQTDQPGPAPDNQTVAISPLQGPPGTNISVEASGFSANMPVTVGLGVANAEPSVEKEVVTTGAGTLQTTIALPEEAEPGRTWRVLVIRDGESALSGDFSVTAGEPASVCGNVTIVRPGDSLSRIARRCNTSVEALLAANPDISNPSVISVGQRIVLPGGSDPAAPAMSISPTAGAPGTTVTVNASGLAPDAAATLAVGPAGEEPALRRETSTNQFGALETTIQIPAGAQPTETYEVAVIAAGETAVSSPFNVTAGAVTATTDYNLRLRAGPSTDTQILDVAPAGTTLEVEGRTAASDWIQVTYLGQTGWMSRDFVTIQGDLNAVPVSGRFTSTQIYLINLGAGDLGCGDAVVPVTVNIDATQAPLTAALEQLLAINQRTYGQTGLYNALYNSSLSVEEVAVRDGVATIGLSGSLQPGGVCDQPRIEAQLRQTALQYDTVDEVEIFVNGQPLAEAL